MRPDGWVAPLRPADKVMRLARMGSFHQSRLSFMRILLRRLQCQNWKFDVKLFEIDAQCVGRAVYCAIGPTHTYSLVAFAHDLPDEQRSDRVIATAWDATFTLFDGVPTEDDLQRLAKNVPLQEAGRITDSELSLSRANRSTRLWGHVVDRLAKGQQPDPELVQDIGYLMRTTAVYGNGKFGAADRSSYHTRPVISGPFQAEMLSVYLTRAFVLDLVEHAAHVKGGAHAVKLRPNLRRQFGIGNSTGLGMAPFLTFHPALLHNWIAAREQALSRVRSVKSASVLEIKSFQSYLKRSIQNARDWHSQHPLQIEKLHALRADLMALSDHINTQGLPDAYPWDGLVQWAEQNINVEGQEQLVSLLLEPYPDLVDDLSEYMKVDEAESFPIDGTKSVAQTLKHVSENYAWALVQDYTTPENSARFWYVSEEKLEPRVGERYQEAGAELEQPQAIARDIAAFHKTLLDWPVDKQLADVLLRHPEHRQVARRAQLTQKMPYAEIRDNQLSADMLPIDMLRCKLSFFGATKFDPRSDRWVRICMYQNAPFPDELATTASDDWAYPSLT